ncbi:cytochrome p450 domain-containing protein [Sarocladium implicatum]|nr:cytochrome p450 domain-containing protein [Sarocladium implicatum]
MTSRDDRVNDEEHDAGYDALRFEPGKDNLVSMRDEDVHSALRKKMAAGYSGKENESIEKTIEHHIAQFVRLLETKYLSTECEYRPVDIARKIQYFTLDVISDLAFGHPFGFMEQDADVFDFIRLTRAFFPVALLLSNLPGLVAVLHSRFFRGILPKETDRIGLGAFIGVVNAKVAERFAADTVSQPDMLGSFIRHGVMREEASRESVLNVMAGSDTSATTMRVMLLSILSNPVAYRRLQSEIDEGIKASRISAPIRDDEARQLPYLQAAIKEALRIKPPAAGLGSRIVPSGGDMIDGKFIPGGTQVGLSAFGIFHSKMVFGEDASIFRPERWLEADHETLASMTSVVDLVFSAGNHHCLGKQVALMELNKIFVELLRRFDFIISRPERPLDVVNAAIWLIEDFPVRIARRDAFL